MFAHVESRIQQRITITKQERIKKSTKSNTRIISSEKRTDKIKYLSEIHTHIVAHSHLSRTPYKRKWYLQKKIQELTS